MLFTHLHLYPVAGEPVEDGYLLTEGGRIAALGPMEKAPEGEPIDCGGLIACPGFIDAHCHLGMWEDSLGFEGDDGNEETDPCTPQMRGLDAVNVLDRGFSEALEAGVTTVMTGPGSANPIAGQFCAIKTCGRCIDDMVVRAPAAIKFAFGENPKTVYNDKSQTPITRMATAAIIREQLYKAKRYLQDIERARQEEDGEEPEYDIKCEALLPLLRGEIPAQMHAHRADDIFTAMRIAKEFGFRAVIVHGTGGHEVADLLKEKGARIITGPVLGTRCKPELRAMSLQGPGILQKAGVPIALCTDHPEVPIGMLALSAGLLCENGLDRKAALEAITLRAAQLCEIDGRVGSLQAGRDADILFFGRDPFSLGAKPQAVLVEGQLVHGELPGMTKRV
ncbi:MAG: amidohydrolase [Provencibacterium sp.]|jgi:imidazolonepropionase-like amidohydrolase|nr:amidohydrolase [Provencibacterium sp.]